MTQSFYGYLADDKGDIIVEVSFMIRRNLLKTVNNNVALFIQSMMSWN